MLDWLPDWLFCTFVVPFCRAFYPSFTVHFNCVTLPYITRDPSPLPAFSARFLSAHFWSVIWSFLSAYPYKEAIQNFFKHSPQSESWCSSSHTKMRFHSLQIKLIFISIFGYQASLWWRGLGKLGIGLFLALSFVLSFVPSPLSPCYIYYSQSFLLALCVQFSVGSSWCSTKLYGLSQVWFFMPLFFKTW